MLESEQPCPCESGASYAECCQPYHLGKTKAPTAETLMRSRYAAYVMKAVDYLVETTLPAVRRTDLRQQYQETADSIQWVRLEVIRATQGSETDTTGKVEFKATYLQDGQRAVHHELSRFRRYQSAWCYLDGQVT